MLEVNVDGLLKPVLKPVDSLLVFPGFRAFFEFFLELSVGILEFGIFAK